MTSIPFTSQFRAEPGLAVIDLHGEINALSDDRLSAVFEQAMIDHPKTVVLNFSDVSYINSTGIALIVGLLAEARKNHCRMVVFGLSDHYTEIFNITRLSDFMTIYTDETSALEDVRGV